MLATRCACGFERLGDEEVSDHLQAMFEPPDSTGTDGQVHLEMDPLACCCGFRAVSQEELDWHFLAVFTPADAVGHDGRRHEAAQTGVSPPSPARVR
jgi:hypothetical protein